MRRTVFLLIVLSLLVFDKDVFAGQKQTIGAQQICGDYLELVWEKTIVNTPDKSSFVQMGVHPSGKNYWIEITYWKKAESSDEPLHHVNILIDPKGNQLWRRDGYIDIPFAIAGDLGVPVGEQLYKTYDRTNVPFDKSLRYHVWLDSKGYIISVYAQRHGLAALGGNIEIRDGIVHNIEPNCGNGFCTIDELAVSENGIDEKGWRTILRWPYPTHSEHRSAYNPATAGSSYLLISKSEPKEFVEEWKLIRFSSCRGSQILSESDYMFPRESSTAFMQDKNGRFVLINFSNREYTFMRLNEEGKEIEKKKYNLPKEFKTFGRFIRAFKNGWLVQSADYNDLLRLSPDGRLMWIERRNNEVVRFIGNDDDKLFFAVKNRLYLCREKRVQN